jgi:hypothetical protein
MQKGKQRKKNMVQSCGFCGSQEHQRQTVCPLMNSHGKKITDVSAFLSYLMGGDAPYVDWNTRPKTVSGGTVMKSWPGSSKHIIIHKKYSTFTRPNSTDAPQLLHTVYEATMIDNIGLPLLNYTKACFEGQAVVKFIGKIADMKGRHVFSRIDDSENFATINQNKT